MYINNLIIFVVFAPLIRGWRAIPANQASYSSRRDIDVVVIPGSYLSDEVIPRVAVFSIYRFGWCRKEVIKRQYLRYKLLVSFEPAEAAKLNYIYVVRKNRISRFQLQCLVVKIMVAPKFVLSRNRFPMYYCVGTVMFHLFQFTQRIDIHELYLHTYLTVPADIHLEFYQTLTKDNNAKELYFGPFSY